jgi:hypothetical protein
VHKGRRKTSVNFTVIFYDCNGHQLFSTLHIPALNFWKAELPSGVANGKRENTQTALKHGLRHYGSINRYIRAQVTCMEPKKVLANRKWRNSPWEKSHDLTDDSNPDLQTASHSPQNSFWEMTARWCNRLTGLNSN